MTPRKTLMQKEWTMISAVCGTDKHSLNHTFAGYQYMDHYASILGASAHWQQLTAPKILEIGIWRGQSLRLWSQLKPEAVIAGLDIDLSQVTENLPVNCKTIQGDQGDVDKLVQVAAEYGPFDLVVDDGAHSYGDIFKSMYHLLPWVTPGGFYCIEDINVGWPLPDWGMTVNTRYAPNNYNDMFDFIKMVMTHIMCKNGPILSVHYFFGLVIFERADTTWSPDAPWSPTQA